MADTVTGDKTGVLILSQTYPPDIGGVETHLSDLTGILEGSDDLRVDVLCYKPIVTRAQGWVPREQRGAVTIRRYWWFGGNLFRRLEPFPVLLFLYITPYFLLRTLVFMLFHARRIDVIHAHGFNMGFVGMVVGCLFGKRVVFQSHALYSFRTGSPFSRVASVVLRRMDCILALCQASKDEIVQLGIPPERVAVYRYWIDLERFNDVGRETARARLGWGTSPPSAMSHLPSTGFVAFFVGRLIGIKGEGVVIRLAEQFPQVTFVMAGDGPGRGVVERAAARLANLRYVGLVANTDLPDYYRAADVTLVPSQYPEGFGRVICEALACGTPVIASRLGGIVDAMDDSVGILCGSDTEAFAHALQRLLDSPEDYRSLRDRARPFACLRFGLRNADRIVESYCQKRGSDASKG